ncbi:MAG TPA: hypothetical protein GXZ85_08805 [Firmicutes bacterium]|jgi:hypothetical protein|nr:hypothetical protein [Bacillota bacterium]
MTRKQNGVIVLASGRNMMIMGLVGLALGIYVGNTMKTGTVSRQVRSTGRILARKARGQVEQMNNWMD